MRHSLVGWIAAAVLVCATAPARAYSVLSHEQVVDLLWKDGIEPTLRARFPKTTAEGMKEAHAYAYGGCVVQDMGYYPFGSHYLSDLAHYVRSGDFVRALVDEAQDANELAFALGALAHYTSDNVGHPTVNRAVPIAFPKLRRKYGDEVTYAQDPKRHLWIEVGFDMVQVAKNRYTSDAYHEFIGFKVSKAVLERAFTRTYGLRLEDALGDVDRAVGSYRHAVSTLVPQLTRIVLFSKKKARRVPDGDGPETDKFLYRLSRAQYESEWGTSYAKPGLLGRIAAFLLRIVPKIGPFKVLKFEVPNAETEAMYIESMNHTTDRYRALLKEVRAGSLALPNLDCDTGRPSKLGEYTLADKTYGRLTRDLARRPATTVPADLRAAIDTFYGDRMSRTPR